MALIYDFDLGLISDLVFSILILIGVVGALLCCGTKSKKN
jgi:hypothetical protein